MIKHTNIQSIKHTEHVAIKRTESLKETNHKANKTCDEHIKGLNLKDNKSLV